MAVEVSLLDMLDARERRVHHQQELLERYHKPLICFTMNSLRAERKARLGDCLYAPLAQLVEQLTLNQWAQGSSPWRCTNKRALNREIRRSFSI